MTIQYFLEHRISAQTNFLTKFGGNFIQVKILIRKFSKDGSGSGQKSSGSVTLVPTATDSLIDALII
jgi:hypothetical protein